MTDFVRARSEEQKQARMAEIKAAADELFCSVPYQEMRNHLPRINGLLPGQMS